MNKFSFLALALLLPCSARAEVIFDNSVNNANQTTETRPTDSMYGAVISTTALTTISQIDVQVRPEATGSVKFLIFDSTSGRGGNTGTGVLLFSVIVPVTGTPGPASGGTVNYLSSGPISFTLQPGKTYDIGVLGTVSLTGVWDTSGDTQNGLTSYSNNANFSNYGNPTTGGYSGVDPHLRLFNSVPEPRGAACVVFAAGALLLGWRRSSRPRA